MKSIFLIFSATPFKMGKFIRFFTKERYNHVSVSFDKELNEAYTVARFHSDTPFYGGLNKDSSERYEYKGKTALISVCEVKVSEEQYVFLLTKCREMYKIKEEFLYNYFSALGSLRNKKIMINNSFTCVEFAVYLLSYVDSRIDIKKFYSVEDLYRIYESGKIYEGKSFFNTEHDTEYNKKHSFIKASVLTFNMIKELIGRK